MKISGYIHIDVMVLETLWEKHKVVVRAPDYIPLLVTGSVGRQHLRPSG
jgi:hypothetical protein